MMLGPALLPVAGWLGGGQRRREALTLVLETGNRREGDILGPWLQGRNPPPGRRDHAWGHQIDIHTDRGHRGL